MDKDEKLEWAAIKEGQSLFSIDLEIACELLNKPSENILGYHPETNEPVIVREARYGPTVQLGSKEGGNKPRYVGLLKTDSIDEITFERALDYLSLPKLGLILSQGKIFPTIGPYGPYFKRGSKTLGAEKVLIRFQLSLRRLFKHIKLERFGALKTFDDSPLKLLMEDGVPMSQTVKRMPRYPKTKTQRA